MRRFVDYSLRHSADASAFREVKMWRVILHANNLLSPRSIIIRSPRCSCATHKAVATNDGFPNIRFMKNRSPIDQREPVVGLNSEDAESPYGRHFRAHNLGQIFPEFCILSNTRKNSILEIITLFNLVLSSSPSQKHGKTTLR